jgi:hypothetical protein
MGWTKMGWDGVHAGVGLEFVLGLVSALVLERGLELVLALGCVGAGGRVIP